MRFTLTPFLAAWLITAAGATHAGLSSVATIPKAGGKVIFELYDDPATLPECTGRNDMGAIARMETGGKVTPYGTGCWSAGGDGFITLKIKSLDDGAVRTSRVHNSEFKAPPSAPSGGKVNSASGFTPWEFSKGVTNRGTPVCALSAADNMKSGARNISIKALGNREQLNITLYDTRWGYKANSKHMATLDFDDQKPLQLDAYGDGQVLDSDLPVAATAIFLSLLREKKTLRISPPGGEVVTVGLTGISDPLRSFVDCARGLKKR